MKNRCLAVDTAPILGLVLFEQVPDDVNRDELDGARYQQRRQA
jgi:hypothetical protein